ncbi:hemolysin family protein [Flagellatimonas centrodinii]|uniref:hemolysin family protein n=1 Tax=Flagellatimonas centrodinii TaxID=2806210 RepID=UPI001FED2B27|nr:hemolysin family protein [Flagellatimonas centrodinii]ULQ47738.1 hemolysin family protein [Flagellatimonas centrodinii]
MILNLMIVGLLIMLNGLLAMSELAVLSSRDARLQAMARRKVAGARAALALRARSGRFLSTVQIGITLVGVFAGAFSGTTLAQPLADALLAQGMTERFADELAFFVVVASVTYLSLIIGELVPKQIALRNPERVAALVAPPMQWLARLARPMVWLLDVSTRLILKLMPARSEGSRITDEEIHALVAEAASSGVVEPEERQMIAAVMRIADRKVRGLMTPRQDVEWIDLDDPLETQLQQLKDCRHSKMLAARGQIDQFVGWVSVKRLFDALLDGREQLIPSEFVEEALVVPETVDALVMIPKLRAAPLRSAIVVDEFGSLQGIVTVGDILLAVAGGLLDDAGEQPAAVMRADGGWLVDGDLQIDALADTLQLNLPAGRDYETAAGMVLALMGTLPRVGETVELDDWIIEVLDLDGRRIDKLLFRRRHETAIIDG